MGGVCYIGPRLGDGLIFEVDRYERMLPTPPYYFIPILLCKLNNFNNDHVRLDSLKFQEMNLIKRYRYTSKNSVPLPLSLCLLVADSTKINLRMSLWVYL